MTPECPLCCVIAQMTIDINGQDVVLNPIVTGGVLMISSSILVIVLQRLYSKALKMDVHLADRLGEDGMLMLISKIKVSGWFCQSTSPSQ